MNEKDPPVLFYDGDCGLCSRSVRFLMRRDRRGLLYYAPLQGATAAARLGDELRKSLSTVIYQREGGEILLRSDAVLHALIDIGSHWRWLARIALLVPRHWRNGIYNWIAARRKKFFASSSCSLSTREENRRMLP